MNHNIKEGDSEVKKKKTFCLCKHRLASFLQGRINKHIEVFARKGTYAEH
jgi:hypothetical protein